MEIQNETQKKIDKVQETMSIRLDNINGEVGHIQEELGNLQNRPIHCQQTIVPDHRETISFRDYRRNPMESDKELLRRRVQGYK